MSDAGDPVGAETGGGRPTTSLNAARHGSHPGAVEVYLQVRYVLWAAVDSSRQITSAAQTRDRPGSSPAKAPDKKMAPSRSPTPRGGLAWYSETKTKLHLFLGARRGRHPLGQFNSPIVPEAVDEMRGSWRLGIDVKGPVHAHRFRHFRRLMTDKDGGSGSPA